MFQPFPQVSTFSTFNNIDHYRTLQINHRRNVLGSTRWASRSKRCFINTKLFNGADTIRVSNQSGSELFDHTMNSVPRDTKPARYLRNKVELRA